MSLRNLLLFFVVYSMHFTDCTLTKNFAVGKIIDRLNVRRLSAFLLKTVIYFEVLQ